jgi:hypothetical protein
MAQGRSSGGCLRRPFVPAPFVSVYHESRPRSLTGFEKPWTMSSHTPYCAHRFGLFPISPERCFRSARPCNPRSDPLPPHALFETHLDVRDLERSIAFYRDVVGLEFAFRLPELRGRAGHAAGHPNRPGATWKRRLGL